MPQFDLEKYVPVHERIKQFWEKYPQGSIATEVSYPDEETVRVRAMVFVGTMMVGNDLHLLEGSTGHAEEKRTGMINKTSAVENCETSAVGRALALLGFEIERGLVSRQEMEKVQRMTNGDAEQGDAEAPKNTDLSLPQKALLDKIETLDTQGKAAVQMQMLALGALDMSSKESAVAGLTEQQIQGLMTWIRSKEEEHAPSPE